MLHVRAGHLPYISTRSSSKLNLLNGQVSSPNVLAYVRGEARSKLLL